MIDHAALAEELWEARRERRTVPTLTGRHPQLDESDAYAIQSIGIDLREDAGETVVGGKLGFTSRAMQVAMGVSSPNYGWLTDAMLVHDRHVDLGSLIHPKCEPEVAFLIGTDLHGPVNATEVMAATAALIPCLEVVDSRYHDFRFAAFDNIADNSSGGMVVLGDAAVDPSTVDPALCGAVLSVNGEVRFTATGAAALDHPAAAVAWMVNRLAEIGGGLEGGAIVISGGLTPPVDLDHDMEVVLELDGLGPVTFRTKE